MSYRIGISMRVTNAKGYKEQRDSIAHDWAKYMLNVFPESKWMFIPNIGENSINYFKQWKLNVLFLSGGDNIGTYNQRDETELSLLKMAIKEKIPVIGICRGMQIIQHFYNGKLLIENENFKAQHKGSRHNIIINGNEYETNSYHSLKIDEESLDKRFEIIARCKNDNSIEAIKFSKILGMMWHPERESKPTKWNEILIRKFLEKNEY